MAPEWFADCKVIGDYAKTKGIKTCIFDEKWWTSFVVDGKVPEELRPKKLECIAMDQSALNIPAEESYFIVFKPSANEPNN